MPGFFPDGVRVELEGGRSQATPGLSGIPQTEVPVGPVAPQVPAKFGFHLTSSVSESQGGQLQGGSS